MCDIELVDIQNRDCLRAQRKEITDYNKTFKPQYSESEIVHEARRCLYCAEPNCMRCCPTQLDAKRMVHAAGEHNFYEAARVALTANPLALSCGHLCSAEECCKAGCNLSKTHAGAIDINAIQAFSLQRFKEYRIMPTIGNIPVIEKSVAIIGAGPAGLAAASFFARCNFKKIVVFERSAHLGGILRKEIQEQRLAKEELDFEIEMIKAYPNIEFKLNSSVSASDIAGLRKQYDYVFVGCGRQKPYTFGDAPLARDFLYGMSDNTIDVKGKTVAILGSGDVAVDCCEAAQEHGASQVLLVMREDIKTATCHKKSMIGVIERNIEIIPKVLPQRLDAKGVICKDLYDPNGIERLIPADMVICAFGFGPDASFVEGTPDANGLIMKAENGLGAVYIGGDYRRSFSIVEAVHDAEVVVASIAKELGVDKIPKFHTPVDDVDISVTVDGIKYENPFGISSAPVSGTYDHLKRCFQAGFGFALTKTYPLEKDIQKNNHIRIVKVYDSQESTSYNNIVMISEHSHHYWLESIKKLKAEFPNKVVIASIMCMDNADDWHLLAKLSEEAGADALELNFSCPNECHGNDGNEGGCEGGFKSHNAMAMAIGVSPAAIERCTRYVVESVHIPVYPKLTPNVGNIEELAAAAMRGGASGVSTINTVFGISEITLSGHPWPQVGVERNTISGGLSGDLVRPIAIRQIAQVLRHNENVRGHLLGIGGVRSAETAMQLIYTGASVVQMCSSVQKWSYDIVDEIISGTKFILYCWSRPDLRGYLNSQGVESFMPYGEKTPFWTLDNKQDKPVPKLAEVTGIALKHIGERKILEGPEKWRVNAHIKNNCIGCGSCALSCRDNSTTAIVKDGNRYRVDDEKCIGCALCSSVCPVNAIEYVKVKGLNEMTPEELKKVPTAF
ncbi:dihydropyrimidine dehydrogenase, putative [Entamoeba dispar SAW760]|uniref:dihydropyrimidine dehydrogenase (NADP(+)) n=1 Tax=Entamoeba dispar (strain ATCC PRA-260 / SAW760) TaxID=370354 RepID=B0EHW2_ENTDS|nr:dihydropyrimidine dehydrogenase, putative [Entamoeba dispar SAW760]EDR25906.1 dihydropyrimidine dehydrogenase, putative [Entamoeba dispar SAW760]|eukprot:EDR25906.1 dihydropyrimidine dehydrogenase, putative [Entamoeba dispar SAW760]